jgi:lysophospholipase L1-like esterase
MEDVPSHARVPQFILFGDSLTEWAFDEHNEGFGWNLEQKYEAKVQVHCEGIELLAATACTR